ncbi:Golgin subfamily A member 5 [Bienertia sinuspersici]
MGYGENVEGPAVLQLHRWDPSHISDLLEYQEAFLSPTRELLLLLSYQSEALLLPLSKGDSYCITTGSCKYECQESVNLFSSSAFSPDFVENFRCTSEFVGGVSNNGFSADRNISQSNTCPFISDVNSLAWGLDVPLESRKNGVGGTSYHAGQESMSHLPSSLTPTKWLRSFLSSAKAMESNGTIWTFFPEKSELPCSATVVSFFIDFKDPMLVDLLSDAHEEKQVHIPVDNKHNALDHTSLYGLDSDANVAATKRYTCFRVFSSWFHYLVGFVLSSGFDKNSCDSSCKSQDTVVLVALLDIYGLQWLYSVKLPGKGICLEADWVDFQISEKFLISLNKSGSVLLHGALTGEYVAYLDVLLIHGIKPEQNLAGQKDLSTDANNTAEDGILVSQNKLDDACICSNQACSVAGKHSFQRLIVAPNSCLFTVVDECGALYMICGNDHVPDKYVMLDNVLPQYQKLGVLAPWVVGHSSTSQQRPFSTSSASEKSVFGDDFGNLGFQHVHNWHIQGNQDDLTLSGFSAISQQSIENGSDSKFSKHIRKLFIPFAKHGVADIICFSPFGVTRLARRNSSIKSAKNCIIHTNLYIESNVCDDHCLNFVNKTFDLQSEEKVVDEETIGCIFQGCLYLVTRSAISIVLPTVSLSSNSHAIGSMSYRFSKNSKADALNLHKSLMYDTSRHLGSPWQVELLDRILLYEGPDEADRLCLENGWNLRISRLRRLQLALAYLKFEEMDLWKLWKLNILKAYRTRYRMIISFLQLQIICHHWSNEPNLSLFRVK